MKAGKQLLLALSTVTMAAATLALSGCNLETTTDLCKFGEQADLFKSGPAQLIGSNGSAEELSVERVSTGYYKVKNQGETVAVTTCKIGDQHFLTTIPKAGEGSEILPMKVDDSGIFVNLAEVPTTAILGAGLAFRTEALGRLTVDTASESAVNKLVEVIKSQPTPTASHFLQIKQ